MSMWLRAFRQQIVGMAWQYRVALLALLFSLVLTVRPNGGILLLGGPFIFFYLVSFQIISSQPRADKSRAIKYFGAMNLLLASVVLNAFSMLLAAGVIADNTILSEIGSVASVALSNFLVGISLLIFTKLTFRNGIKSE
jgi:hypothetical protein